MIGGGTRKVAQKVSLAASGGRVVRGLLSAAVFTGIANLASPSAASAASCREGPSYLCCESWKSTVFRGEVDGGTVDAETYQGLLAKQNNTKRQYDHWCRGGDSNFCNAHFSEPECEIPTDGNTTRQTTAPPVNGLIPVPGSSDSRTSRHESAGRSTSSSRQTSDTQRCENLAGVPCVLEFPGTSKHREENHKGKAHDLGNRLDRLGKSLEEE